MSTDLLFDAFGFLDAQGVYWRLGEVWEANALLSQHHYLGPLRSGAKFTVIGTRDGSAVAAMLWKNPTSRGLPPGGSWLELSRWCLTPSAGDNAGSRMHRWATRLIRDRIPGVTTLVSYSDPAHGHTGALYRACNWQWAPTWHRLRTPPSGNGDWGTGPQAVKDRWVFCLSKDATRADVLRIEDRAAVRHWQANATETERRWAQNSLNLRDAGSVDEQRLDALPGDEALGRSGRDSESRPLHGSHRHVVSVQTDGPPNKGRQHVPGVSLSPVKVHAPEGTP